MSLMANHHTSPTMSMQMQQHAQSGPPAPPNPAAGAQYAPSRQIHALNEAVWMQIGTFLIIPTG
jgi:general transcriptional corepressor CYC8